MALIRRFPAISPIIGAILGGAGASLFFFLPKWLAALIAVFMWTAISTTRFRPYGLVIVGMVARWLALQFIPPARILEVCIVAQAVPPAAMIVLAWISRPSADESYVAFASSLTTFAAILAILQGLAASLLPGFSPGLLILAGCYLIVRYVRSYFYKRIGGIDVASLDTTGQLVELFILGLFTIPRMYQI